MRPKVCVRCGSFAINHHCHGRDGSRDDLCDVCYWRARATKQAAAMSLLERCANAMEYDQGQLLRLTNEVKNFLRGED